MHTSGGILAATVQCGWLRHTETRHDTGQVFEVGGEPCLVQGVRGDLQIEIFKCQLKNPLHQVWGQFQLQIPRPYFDKGMARNGIGLRQTLLKNRILSLYAQLTIEKQVCFMLHQNRYQIGVYPFALSLLFSHQPRLIEVML